MANNKNNNKTANKPVDIKDEIVDTTVTEVEADSEIEANDNEDIKDVLADLKELTGASSEVEAPVKAPASEYKLLSTDKVECRSLFHGKLTYKSPINGALYTWNHYGATRKMTVEELETMNNHKPAYLNKPYLVVSDPAIVEEFNLADVYRKVHGFTKLSVELQTKSVTFLRKRVKDLVEVGLREHVIAEVRKQRIEKALVNIDIISMLSEVLKTVIE